MIIIIILILLIIFYLYINENFCEIKTCNENYSLSINKKNCCKNIENVEIYNDNCNINKCKNGYIIYTNTNKEEYCGLEKCDDNYILSNDYKKCCPKIENVLEYDNNCNIKNCNGFIPNNENKVCCNLSKIIEGAKTYDNNCNPKECDINKGYYFDNSTCKKILNCGSNYGEVNCTDNKCCSNLGTCGGIVGIKDNIYCSNDLNIGYNNGKYDGGINNNIVYIKLKDENKYSGYNNLDKYRFNKPIENIIAPISGYILNFYSDKNGEDINFNAILYGDNMYKYIFNIDDFYTISVKNNI